MAPRLTYGDQADGPITFAAFYRTSMSAKPVADEAHRTTIYVEYTLDVQGYVTTAPGETWQELRKKLTKPAGELYYQEHGYDGATVFHVNGSSRIRDVKWGPWPELLDFTPLGGHGNASRVHWRCVICIPECDGAVQYTKHLMALNFTAHFSIDQDGYTTERVEGYLEVPITRKSEQDRTVPDCADLYRREVLAKRPPQPGWQRKGQDYKVSQDRRRLDFSWSDEELPSPLPRKVTKIQARHAVETSLKEGFTNWNVEIDATITMARGVAKSESLPVFLQLIDSRTAIADRKKTVLPVKFRVEDDIFGRGTRYSYAARYLNTVSIGMAMQALRLWRHIDGSDWTDWRTSMATTEVTDPGGPAQRIMAPSEDWIVDLCLGDVKPIPPPYLNTPPPIFRDPPPDKPKPDDSIKPKKPKPDETWVEYEARLRYRSRSSSVRHKKLPKTPQGETPRLEGFAVQTPSSQPTTPPRGGSTIPFPVPPGPPGGKPGDAPASTIKLEQGGIGAESPQGAMPSDTVQTVTSPTRTIVLHGHGVRYGYRVPVPYLTRINGVPVVEFERHVEETSYEAVLGVPLFRTDWAIEYILPAAPAGMFPTQGNPALGISGEAGDRSSQL